MFYKITPDNEPVGVEYRVLSTRTDLFGDCHAIETKESVDGLVELTIQERECLGDVTHCIVPFKTKQEHDPTSEIDSAVSKITELSYKYPDKVAKALKGKVDQSTTENLLSADGKPIKLDAPQGWKA
jgi:hypothetical protein